MASGAEQEVFDQLLRFIRAAIRPQRDEGVGGPCHRQSGLGNIQFAGHVEPPQVGWLLQLCEALKQHGFGGITGLPGSVWRFGGLIGTDAIEPVRNNIEEQARDVALEDLSDLGGGSQSRVVSGCPIEPNHHVLDHGGLPTSISSSNDLIRAIDSTTGSTATTRNVWSLPSCALIETYSPGKKACLPNL